jgi:hypothetical protein
MLLGQRAGGAVEVFLSDFADYLRIYIHLKDNGIDV